MIQAQNLRQIKLRIRSIQNTRKITRAMEMVSASKLGKVKTPFFMNKPYLAAIEKMLYGLISDAPGIKSPLLEKRESVKNAVVCVITSDTGLCGSYNNNMIKYVEQFIKGLKGGDAAIVAVGKEGYSYFRKSGYRVAQAYLGSYGRYSSETADRITNDLIDMFVNRKADEVYIAYSRFRASLRHQPAVEKLLNIEPLPRTRNYYIFEPSTQGLFDKIARNYMTHKMRAVLLEAFTSEHSARMMAMKTATDNADDLTDQLTLSRNKARQFAITKEVLEIAASAEALKG